MRFPAYWIVVAFVAGLALAPRGNDSRPTQLAATSHPTEDDTPSYAWRDDGRDKDCRDFASHDEAQAFFEAHGAVEDPHRLDGDHDGVACERLR